MQGESRELPTRRRIARSGFTVVELLVTLFVIGVLIAIIVPAVQSMRRTARATECRNRMRNLIMASHAMQASTKWFPASFKPFVTNGYTYSMHVQLLPFLEQVAVLESFDFTKDPRWRTNRPVVYGSRPIVFVCPEATDRKGMTSYLGNSGSGLPPNGSSDFTDLRDGFLQAPPGTQPADFKDGLSNTLAISECGQMKDAETPAGQFLLISANIADRSSWEIYRDDCWQRFRSGSYDDESLQAWYQGEYWASPQLPDTRYTHVFPPNTVSCFDSAGGHTKHAISTAGSNHSGFLNGALADGSVKRISFEIDQTVWAGLGARSDGSVVSE